MKNLLKHCEAEATASAVVTLKATNGSLSKQILLTAAVGLVLALTLIGVVMDQAFKEKTLHLVKERLESYSEALLAEIEVNNGQPVFPQNFPSPRFNQPASGMYADIISTNHHWRSPSTLGQNLPAVAAVKQNQRKFELPIEHQQHKFFRLSQGVVVEQHDESIELSIIITEHAGKFYQELRAFEETLLTWLIAISLCLTLMQWLLMIWATRPLKKLSKDLAQLELGGVLSFDENYPSELLGLTSSVNRLLANERDHLQRQRKTLGDLAHSLKTPLAVIQSELGSRQQDSAVIQQQLDTMNEIVAYQLKKAAVAGHLTFSVGVPVIDTLDEITRTLQKLHRQRNITIHKKVAPGAVFYGEKGDLMELLGNLLENAFKWCDQHISITIKTLYLTGRQRTGLRITITDDGPGIPAQKQQQLLQRGVRGDEQVTGHGIGLSIVTDIVEAYQGQIKIDRDPKLQGACFTITLPP